MKSMFALFSLVLMTSLAFAQTPTLINGFETLAGVTVMQSKDLPTTKLTITTEAEQITEGKGALHLAATSPTPATGNTYASVVVTTPPVDMRGKALQFDAWTTLPATTGALYVRGYDKQGQPVLSWMSWANPLQAGKQTFELVPGVSLGALSWEPGFIKSTDHSAVVRWEFYIGTSQPGVDYDLYLDNMRVVTSTVKSFLDIKQAHRLYPETPLVIGGKSEAMIVAPEDKDWQEVANGLAASIAKATGATLPIKSSASVTNDDMTKITTILLGNVANNRALLYPYSHMMTFADGVFPGAGGYEIRTVSDPWGTQKNIVIIGATDLAGAKAGLAAFTKLLKDGADLTLPRTVQVQLGQTASRWNGLFDTSLDDAWMEGQKKTAETCLQQGGHTGLFSQMAGVGQNFAVTGRPEYARMFVWLAQRAYAYYLTKPDTYGGPWGMDSDFTAYQVLPAWDAVEECPELTDAERLEVATILFKWVSEACLPEGNGAAATAAAGKTVSNHGTFAALGTFSAGEYFSRYYDSAEGKQWIKIGDTCFQNLTNGSKVHEDCNGYQWLTNLHIIRYCLTKPDLTFFANGNARKTADYAILTMNNLGYQVPYGDTGDWKCWFSELPVLRAAEWYYRDGRYQWAVNWKVKLTGRVALGEFDPGNTTTEPNNLVGTRAWPLDSKFYKAEGGTEVVPEAKALDKIAFRASYDPTDMYLLLDGLNNGGHRHMDGNSIEQWTQNERVWIADADYIKSLPKYHNGVLILKDGQSATIPPLAELEHVVDLPRFGGSTTTLRNYAGVDWHRNVLWIKGGMYIVVDQMTAKEPGDYSFRAIWQTVGDVKINQNGLDIEQKGQFARFATTADARCLLEDDAETGKNWASYPFANKPVVRVFQAVYNRKLEAGQSVNLFTVLHASGDQVSAVRVQRVTDNLAAITGIGDPILVGVADGAGKIVVPGGPQLTGQALILMPQRAFAMGLQSVSTEGPTQDFPGGADIECNLGTGEMLVKAPMATTATTVQQLNQSNAGFSVEPDEMRNLIGLAISTAPQAAVSTATASTLAMLTRKWHFMDKLDTYLLTNNADSFEAVDAGLKLSAQPEPLARNPFGAEDNSNTLDNLTDGVLLTTDGGVMWDDNQKVTVDFTFDQPYDLNRLTLKAWYATSSSKQKLYQIGHLQALASNDGFQKDIRTLVDFEDTATHGNWGAPGYGPQTYDFPEVRGQAQAVRLILTPKPGTAIYLSEVQLWGNRPGLEVDLSTKLARGLPVHTFRTVKAADLNGDGRMEIIAGSTNGMLFCFATDGTLLWKLDCGGQVNSVNTVDFQGDGKLTVIAGCMNDNVLAIDATGKQLWVFNPPYYKRVGHVRTVFPADLKGDGKQVAIAGSDNWHYYALDAQGKEIWAYESVHGSTAGCAIDMDGDKKQEVVAGTEYYWWHVINPDGSQRFGYNTSGGPCANAVAAGDLDGDGKQKALYGGADTLVHALNGEGKLLWTFNTGDEVEALQCVDVNGDGKDEVLVSSLSFNLYCLDGSGKALWRQDLGAPIRTMTVFHKGGKLLVAAGCNDGHVYISEAATGTPVAIWPTGTEVITVATVPQHGADEDLIVTTADGNLTILGF